MSDIPQGLTPFDAMISGGNLQMMKAVIPYIHGPQQKLFSVFIKFNELQNTIKLFDQNSKGLSACSAGENVSPMDMLNDLRKYCAPEQRDSIDMAINIFSAMQMFSAYQEMNQNSSDSSTGESSSTGPFDQMKMFLSPEQQAMFETYSQMFQNEGGNET